jgi:phosphate transport system protein
MSPMRIPLQEDLDTLQATLMEEGELCARALRGAIQAIRERDPELADEVIAFDDEVDSRYIAIEQGVEALLARQTPVASDLRLVLAIIHINLSLERIADLCVTIAKLTKLVYGVAPDHKLVEAFEEMGARGEEMLKIALEGFMNRDVPAAESLMELDELIDRANRRAVHHLLALGSNLELREWGLRMIIVSRCLERIGDHTVDIGEQTAYLVTGEFREFTDASHVDATEA